jgi:hypothetical protein
VKVNEKKAHALRLLEEAEQELVDDVWASLPQTTVETHQLLQTRRDMVDFLRVPAMLDKAHVVAFVRSISGDELERENILSDIDTAQSLLRNVKALLRGE